MATAVAKLATTTNLVPKSIITELRAVGVPIDDQLHTCGCGIKVIVSCKTCSLESSDVGCPECDRCKNSCGIDIVNLRSKIKYLVSPEIKKIHAAFAHLSDFYAKEDEITIAYGILSIINEHIVSLYHEAKDREAKAREAKAIHAEKMRMYASYLDEILRQELKSPDFENEYY